jgi:hypothetical protein
MAELPNPPNVDLEESPPDPEAIKRDRDLALVNQEYFHYQSYRSRNHDPRWNTADELYHGVVPQRTWEGTDIKRSSIAVEIAFDQVQSALPLITAALFGTDGDWFDVVPLPGTSIQEALARKAALRYALECPDKMVGGDAKTEITLAVQSLLQYGNGGVQVAWNPATKTPKVEWLDIRDLYVDPSTPTPHIDTGRSAIYRQLMTVDELEALRDDPDFSIPSRELLIKMANARPTTFGDQTIATQAAAAGEGYSTADEFLPNPTDRFVEVLVRWSATKVVWVLNRIWVAYDQKNEYNFIPYCIAPCYTVLRRFYAEGMVDKQEGNQRYSQALLNLHLDKKALALQPPRIEKHGGYGSNRFLFPGGRKTVGDPKNDVTFPINFDDGQTVFEELAYIQQQAYSRTGVNGLMQNGMPMKSNASRTAAGIEAQTQGPLSRLQKIVQNVEDYLIVPMLYKMSKMLDAMTEGEAFVPGLMGKDQVGEVPTAMLHGKPVKFKMQAASKMLTREKIAGLFPLVSQFLLSGPVMSELSKIGQTVNFPDVFRMFQDATGTADLYQFIRPMNEQEKQAMQAPPPQVQAMMQAKQMDQQTRMAIMDKKVEADLTKAALSHDAQQTRTSEESARHLIDKAVESMKPKELKSEGSNSKPKK